MVNNVDHPSHYHADSGIEVIDAIEAWGLGFSLGNAVKYIARAGHKNDAIEDLRKALWYVQREIGRMEKANVPFALDHCCNCMYDENEVDEYPCRECKYAWGAEDHFEKRQDA